MILPKIAAVATATPPHRFTQTQLLTMTGDTDATRRGFFDRVISTVASSSSIPLGSPTAKCHGAGRHRDARSSIASID